MTSILCLAHFCEVHGPTPLMVTEGLPVKCDSCDDHGAVPELLAAVTAAAASAVMGQGTAITPTSTSPRASAQPDAVAATLRNMKLASEQRSSSKPVPNPLQDAPAKPKPTSAPSTSSTRSGATAPPSPPSEPASDSTSHFRRTYDDSVTKRAIPCDNCAMTVPSKHESKGSAADAANAESRNPTLRTRVRCARVYDNAVGEGSQQYLQPSPSVSSNSSSDTENDDRASARYYERQHHHRRTGTMNSATSRSSTSSSASRAMKRHDHFCDYTSTHEPAAANAYYIIRASCLRTLTLESLPRSSAPTSGPYAGVGTHFPLTPQPAPMAPSYFTSSPHGAAGAAAAAAAASNGGPLFFGDPTAGYTTAHVFRVADVHARGHKRVYALIALSTHRERMAMKAFGFISAAFHELATWIQQMADAETERAALESESATVASYSGASSPATTANSANSARYGFSGLQAQTSPQVSPHVSPPPTQPSSVVNDSPMSQGSSFLAAAGTGLSRRMGPGYAGFGGMGGSAIAAHRARGLPEILGKPDFFIELHAHFVRLLLELGVTLST